jgi:hypothetical protein
MSMGGDGILLYITTGSSVGTSVGQGAVEEEMIAAMAAFKRKKSTST